MDGLTDFIFVRSLFLGIRLSKISKNLLLKFTKYLYCRDHRSCEYVRNVLGLYAARRNEVCIGVSSLECRAEGRIPEDPGSIPV